jgi:prepilin-type N-terminal cleavage/methylation domain-containing protein
MTLIEMMIALVLFGVIAGSALAMFRAQSRAFTAGNERAAALQNGQFALEMLFRDLRATGSGAPDQQPALIYGGADVVAINADLTTNVANDVFAVYYDAAAPTGAVTAMLPAQRFNLPNTAFAWPDSAYAAGGANSPAETIVFYLRPDSTTSRSDDYVLLRQVNRQPSELVARNLLQTGTTPFFQYERLRVVNSVRTIQPVPAGSLPLRHTVPLHLSAADTGAAALIDSVRGVRVSITVTNGLTGADERQRVLSRLIPLPNAGLAVKRSCGDAPILGGTLTATLVTGGPSGPVARLQWAPAVDETGGERDVVRYVIWRRTVSGGGGYGDPYLSIPAGAAAYSHDDAAVESGETYQYQLAAQDCTPLVSNQVTSGTVAIP